MYHFSNHIYIISNLKKEELNDIENNIKEIGIGAESGYYYKSPNNNNYETLMEIRDCKIIQNFIKNSGHKGVINLYGNLCFKKKNKNTNTTNNNDNLNINKEINENNNINKSNNEEHSKDSLSPKKSLNTTKNNNKKSQKKFSVPVVAPTSSTSKTTKNQE